MNTASALFLLTVGLSLNLSTIRAAAEELDPKKILEEIPKDLLKDISGSPDKRKPAIDAASTQLRQKFRGDPGDVSVRVSSTNMSNGRYVINVQSEQVRASGTNFNVSYYIYLDPAENAKAAKIKKGDRVKVSGKTSIYMASPSDTYTLLSITLNDAKLK
ncbi:hypothetical protein BGE01nite_03100 [Brevifollis gellanilyticus]|uniref:Uncharacterized protein n=2 Tax=Brevifollis gellanilyticus TaxID=748831 RepID=A0A512M2Q3_9BACT|nr:hypothetical protein BGE01nite_03100 [Brevifollis gellanilyticus]